VSFGEAQDGAAEQHTTGCQDIGDVPDRAAQIRPYEGRERLTFA
jgi:hypothetical protein